MSTATVHSSDGVSIPFTALAAKECQLFHRSAEASTGEGVLSVPFTAAVLNRVASLCEFIASTGHGELTVEQFGADIEAMLMVLNASIFFEASCLQQSVCSCVASLLRSSCSSRADLSTFREAFGVINQSTDANDETEASSLACLLWQLQAEQTDEAREPCAASLQVGDAVVTGDALQSCLAMCDSSQLEVLMAVSPDWREAVRCTIRTAPREPGWLPLRKYLRAGKEVLLIRSCSIYGSKGHITFVDGTEEETSAKEATQLVRQLGFKVTRRLVEHDRYYGGIDLEGRPPEDPQAAAEPVYTCRPDDIGGCRCAFMRWDTAGLPVL